MLSSPPTYPRIKLISAITAPDRNSLSFSMTSFLNTNGQVRTTKNLKEEILQNESKAQDNQK
jgi:hypothetical protein